MKAVTAVIGAVLAALFLSAVFGLVAGWALMLAVGVIHHEWITSCPTIGYWWAVLLACLLRGALYQLPSGGGDK